MPELTEETKGSVEATLREIRRGTRKNSTAEKVRTPALACGVSVVVDGLRVDDTIAKLFRREGIYPDIYY